MKGCNRRLGRHQQDETYFIFSISSVITATYQMARFRAGKAMLFLRKKPSKIHVPGNHRTLDLQSTSRLPGKPSNKTLMRLREEEQSYFQKRPPIKNIGTFRLLRVAGAPLVERRDDHTELLSTHAGEWKSEDCAIHRSCLQHRQIRLLRLIAWDGSDTRIEFRTTSLALDSKPDFVAISYVWGSNRVAKTWRSIDGSRIPVTESLDSLLREHISTLGQQWVWVDALCIDQTNASEKSAQVRQMGEIFGSARAVNIWLGAGAPEKVRALESIWGMLRCLKSDTEYSGNPIPTSFNDQWQVLQPLFELPWFRRVWVVQEVTVAARARMYYGTSSIPWSAMWALFRALDGHYHVLDASPAASRGLSCARTMAIISWLYAASGREQTPTAETLIALTLESQSSLPEDKVFSVLGIASNSATSALPAPDYNMLLEDVFIEAGKCRLRTGGAPCFLPFAGIGRPRSTTTKLPSWAPDFASWAEYHPGITTDLAHHFGFRRLLQGIAPPGQGNKIERYFAPYSALGECKTVPQEPVAFCDDHTMRISSVRCDIVEEVLSEIHFDEHSVPSLYTAYIETLKKAKRALRHYPTGQSVADAHWRTLIGDRTSEWKVPPKSWGEQLRRAATLAGAGCNPQQLLTCLNHDSIRLYIGQVWEHSRGRRLAFTRRGYMGIVPKVARPGDVVVLFLRCRRTIHYSA